MENGSITLTARAPAKINLSLRVGSKRSDGFHHLESIVAPLALSDLVSIDVDYSKNERSCSVGGAELNEDQSRTISGPANLAYRAAEFMLDLSPKSQQLGFKIRITKNIPLEAGLGGGSSDAAAVLRLLSAHLGVSLSESKLSTISSVLGADIPCLIDPRIKLVTGRGEQLTDLELDPTVGKFLCEDLTIGLIKPSKGISTAEAYGWLNRSVETSTNNLLPSTRDFISFLGEERFSADDCFTELRRHLLNDFQDPVSARHAGVRAIIEAISSKRRLIHLLSGSGSTVIVFGKRGSSELQQLLHDFKAQGFFSCETAIALS